MKNKTRPGDNQPILYPFVPNWTGVCAATVLITAGSWGQTLGLFGTLMAGSYQGDYRPWMWMFTSLAVSLASMFLTYWAKGWQTRTEQIRSRSNG